ncbi:MAG: branched-chain amino acid ABC transporter permease [Acholeplasmataceae bacterium]|nr:branched-chain amino acid ABC transporter permease [Acholeplasmataceae bacterium]
MSLASFLGILFAALSQAAVLALVTLGIVLIFKTSFTTNFAQGMVGTLSAFTVTMFQINTLSVIFPHISGTMIILLSLIFGVLFGFAIGLFIDVILIRKSRYSNPLSKQMITMGIVLFLTGLIPTVFRKNIDDMPTPRPISTGKWIFNVSGTDVIVPLHNVITIIIAIVIISVIFIMLKYTKWGLGVRATASNEKVASMMGVNTKLITALSWGIACGLGSIGAALYAPMTTSLTLGMMVFMQVNGFLAAVLGGFATFFGPIVGAILIPIITVYLYGVSDIWNVAFVYVIILIIILIKPVGIFGKRIAKKV